MNSLANFGTIACELAVWGLFLGGLVGAFFPVLPGSPLVLAGALLHKLVFPDSTSWWLVGLLAVAVLVSMVFEWVGGILGAKYFGASAWGMSGALLGGLVGIFFSLPGMLIGSILGAVFFEWMLARKRPLMAGKAGLGVIAGILCANVTHFIICVLMVLAFVFDAYVWGQ